jgi:hypothetical protein
MKEEIDTHYELNVKNVIVEGVIDLPATWKIKPPMVRGTAKSSQ